MKPHRQIFKICFQIIFLSLLTLLSAYASEPSYNGKPLSEWLLILKERHAFESIEEADAQEAVRQIGTNGIPTMIDLLNVYDERSAKKVLSKLHNKDLTAWYKYEENPFSAAENVRKLALEGFSVLGTNAEFAVPQILKVLALSDEAAHALIVVGPRGFSALTNEINDPNAGVRDTVIRAIGKEGGGDTNAIRQLLANALKDPDTHIRLHAADFLRDKAPDLVVATLMPLLDVSGYDRCRTEADKVIIYGNCRSAADTLATLGPAAKSAAPKIFSVFTNVVSGTNEYLIRCLTGALLGALKNIDRDTAAEAEDFILNGGPLGTVGYGWTDTLLPNGKKLIAGGCFESHVFSRAQLYDPITGKRTEIGSMNGARCGHMAVLLSDGKVLVAGGSDLVAGRVHDLSSAELYDPTTEKWTITGSMKNPHRSERLALQPNGKVLVYEGGFDQYPVVGHELYDPATVAWTVIPKEQERNRAWRSSPNQQ
jgi:hypothetical protein